MARQIRVAYPGAGYHVMRRGNQGQAIFREDLDRERSARRGYEPSLDSRALEREDVIQDSGTDP